MKNLFASLFAVSLLAAPAAAEEDAPLKPVSGFDVTRYLGDWHEIASIPAWFQDHCASDTMASYGVEPESGLVTVLNRCRDEAGEWDAADGYARFTGPRDEGGLEVTFLSLFGTPIWLISGDYVVVALDEDYRWSAVGHPSRDYAWILSREPEMAEETIKEIAARFAAVGYDTCEILTSPRKEEEARRPLCEL
ncbi:MAG: lipocalin family protein [Limibacillus sp.]|jgi:apolipoprotein D and lipocalin family protein